MTESRSPHVSQREPLVLRLDGRRRQASPQIAPHRSSSKAIRSTAEKGWLDAPYAEASIGFHLAKIHAKTTRKNGDIRAAVRALMQVAADTRTSELHPSEVIAAQASWHGAAQNTRRDYSVALRRVLRSLAAVGAPDLTNITQVVKVAPPRQVVPLDWEVRRMAECPDPGIRWIVFAQCDLGLRTGTACAVTVAEARVGGVIRRTKYGSFLNLPMSDRMRRLAASTEGAPDEMTVLEALTGKKPTDDVWRWRWRQWATKNDINPNLKPHDFRRGLARKLYEETKDVRMVQALLGHQHMATTTHYLETDKLSPTAAQLDAARAKLQGKEN